MKTSFNLDKKIYLLKFEKILNNFCEKLQDYINNPNDKNIHDIRVMFRRLETAYRMLPKNLRKKQKIKNYVEQSKTLFSLNAEIRDFDIICAKMESRYQDKTCDVVTALRNFRIENLISANRLALKILCLNSPKISARILKESKLNKRYIKVLEKIKLDIQKNTIITLRDKKKIDELHMLRKDCKKLRYSLELATDQNETGRVLKNLRGIQNILGDIHDNDIIIDCLRNMGQNSKYLDVIESEVLERGKKYKMFIATFKNRISKQLSNL